MAHRLSAPDVSPAIARKIAARASGADEAIVVGTRAGVIEWANAAWSKVTGYAVDDAINKPIGWLLEAAEIEPPVVDFVQRNFLGGLRCEVEFPVSTPDGRHLWIHLDVEPFRNEQGEISDFVAVATDITARRAGELALEDRIARALAESPIDAEHGEPSLHAHGFAHASESSPSAATLESLAALAAIVEAADAADQRYSRVSPAEALAHTRAIAKRCLESETSIATEMIPSLRRVDIDEEIAAVCTGIAPQLPATVALDAEFAAPRQSASVDVRGFRTLVDGLMLDAVRAIGSEWGTLSVTTGRAEAGRALASAVHPTTDRLPLMASQAHIYVEIHDTAPSLSRPSLAYVRERLGARPNDSRTLGLALASERARVLGGALRVHSLPGVGTRVVIYLPI